MNREEAMYLLNNLRSVAEGKEDEAIDTAIEALSSSEIPTESTNTPTNTPTDLISRADAIEALGEEPEVWTDTEEEWAYRNAWVEHISAIKSLPSAEPKTGEWDDIGGFIRWGCPFCHHAYESRSNYCPNCGARMRGEEE